MSAPAVASRSAVRPRGIMTALVLGYLGLIPYQFELAGRTRITTAINFAPSDLLLLLTLLLVPSQYRYRRPAWTGWHLAMALTFCVGAMVTAMRFGVIQRYELLNKGAGLFLPFLSYAAITSVVTEWDDVRRMLRVFTIGVVVENTAAVAGFLAAYFLGVVNPFTRYGGLRLSGMLLDPNAYGGLLVVALVICEGGSLGRDPLMRGPLLWYSRLTLALGILFTFSRSAWVALGAALLVLAVIQTRAAIRLVALGAVAAPCLFLLMGNRFVPIFEVMASRPKQVQGRFDLIHSALEAFKQHPFLGGGLGSFRLGEGEIAHNTAMWFLADFGIVGLCVVLGFLGWFFIKGWYAYRLAPARDQPLMLALLLAHAAMLGLAMGIEAFYQRSWWMVFGLIASSYCLTLRRANHSMQDC